MDVAVVCSWFRKKRAPNAVLLGCEVYKDSHKLNACTVCLAPGEVCADTYEVLLAPLVEKDPSWCTSDVIGLR